jgi:hypothetical protein
VGQVRSDLNTAWHRLFADYVSTIFTVDSDTLVDD